MSMDTNAWKALLEGTEPGPWRASLLADGIEHEDGSSNYRGGIYPEGQGSPPILVTNGMDKQNARLIAAAPAAVAEVVRLRRELEQLRDDLGQANYGGQDDVSWYLQGQVAEAERVGRQIITILEGNNE